MPHRSEALLVGRDFFLAQFDSEPDCARLVQPATDGPVDDDPLRVASAEVRREVVVLAARPEVVPADLNVGESGLHERVARSVGGRTSGKSDRTSNGHEHVPHVVDHPFPAPAFQAGLVGLIPKEHLGIFLQP